MPAEWEPHEATWIAWPHQPRRLARQVRPHPLGLRRDRPPPAPPRARSASSSTTRPPSSGAPAAAATAPASISAASSSSTSRPTASGRATTGRSSCATRPASVAVTDWHFNAWAKYDNWQRDDAVPGAARPTAWACRCWQPRVSGRRVVLEGGSIDVNGAGPAADDGGMPAQPGAGAQPRPDARQTTSRCFADYLGVRKVLWLDRGIAGDDTHGHVDDLARFVGPRTVVTVVEDDPGRRELRAAAGEPGAPARHDRPGRPAAGGA